MIGSGEILYFVTVTGKSKSRWNIKSDVDLICQLYGIKAFQRKRLQNKKLAVHFIQEQRYNLSFIETIQVLHTRLLNTGEVVQLNII